MPSKKSTSVSPASASYVTSTTPSTSTLSGMQNMQNLDLDKMTKLLEKSKGLMNDLRELNIPGMPNILGGLGQ